MIADVKGSLSLWAFSLTGEIVFRSAIPDSIGRIDNPPIISSKGDIFVLGNDGLLKYDDKGALVHSVDVLYHCQDTLYPLLYNDLLVVCYGQFIVIFDTFLKTVSSRYDIEGVITTPLVSIDGKSACFGTTAGLFMFGIESASKK